MVRLPPANTRSGREKRAKKYPPISAPGSSRMAACMELAKVTPLPAAGKPPAVPESRTRRPEASPAPAGKRINRLQPDPAQKLYIVLFNIFVIEN